MIFHPKMVQLPELFFFSIFFFIKSFFYVKLCFILRFRISNDLLEADGATQSELDQQENLNDKSCTNRLDIELHSLHLSYSRIRKHEEEARHQCHRNTSQVHSDLLLNAHQKAYHPSSYSHQ